MDVTDLTDSDLVRAVLGVSEEELENTTIESTIFGARLTEDMYALNASMPGDFETIVDLPVPSALQTRFLNLVEAWASYTVASYLLESISMFAPKEIEASRDRFARVEDPYSQLKADVTRALATVTSRLLAVYAQLDPVTPVTAAEELTYATTIDLGTDPVTGV